MDPSYGKSDSGSSPVAVRPSGRQACPVRNGSGLRRRRSRGETATSPTPSPGLRSTGHPRRRNPAVGCGEHVAARRRRRPCPTKGSSGAFPIEPWNRHRRRRRHRRPRRRTSTPRPAWPPCHHGRLSLRFRIRQADLAGSDWYNKPVARATSRSDLNDVYWFSGTCGTCNFTQASIDATNMRYGQWNGSNFQGLISHGIWDGGCTDATRFGP